MIKEGNGVYCAHCHSDDGKVLELLFGGICENCLDLMSIISNNQNAKLGLLKDCESSPKVLLGEPSSKLLLGETTTWDKVPNMDLSMSAKEIYEYLGKSVIGQEKARKNLSAMIIHHQLFLADPVGLSKRNILMAGPSGSGKTLLVRRAGEIIGSQVFEEDASQLTEAGYVGRGLNDVIKSMYTRSNQDLKKTESSIIWLDEFDKLSTQGAANGVGGRGVMNQILTMIEGTDIAVTIEGKDDSEKEVIINTSKMLFILSGAYAGIEDVMNKRSIGLTAQPTVTSNQVNRDGLKKYGMTNELINRISSVIILNKLDKENLMKIIDGVENSAWDRLNRKMKARGIYINDISSDTRLAIAEKVIKDDSNARGIPNILESIGDDLLFDHKKYQKNKIDIMPEHITGEASF